MFEVDLGGAPLGLGLHKCCGCTLAHVATCPQEKK